MLASPAPAITAHLDSVRQAVRDDVGIARPDENGIPHIGTGHCHDVCMEADAPGFSMTGGWFLHPDGYHYEHSWLVDEAGNIIDPTADQWHLTDYPPTALIPADSPEHARYIVGKPDLIPCDYDPTVMVWDEVGEYYPIGDFKPIEPPSLESGLRGVIV